MSKHILAGLRVHPTESEVQNSLELEQCVMGVAMGNLAALSFDSTPAFHRANSTDSPTKVQIPQLSSMAAAVQAITWDMIAESSSKDKQMTQLANLIRDGPPENKQSWPSEIAEYHRVIVAGLLRDTVLETLHAAHQGTSGMNLRAGEAVVLPGISDDILMRRLACSTCQVSTLAASSTASGAPDTTVPI